MNSNKKLISAGMSALFFLATTQVSHGQDTFSIVAVDVSTGQVGSAGATCLDDSDIAGGAIIISDVIPDHGAVHTQSYWIPANQNNAHEQFTNGLSPDELMEWLENNDVQSNPGLRQYGAADLITGVPRAGAFTGSACMDYHGHIVGENYAIQGNILLDETILPAMEEGFNSTEGSLAERLMAALQGANVPGADSRCLKEGVSSQSAFIRVAYPGDDPNNLTLDLNVSITPEGVEPITELQDLFDTWNQSLSMESIPAKSPFKAYQDSAGQLAFSWDATGEDRPQKLVLTSMSGQEGSFNIHPWSQEDGSASGHVNTQGFVSGTYIVRLISASGNILGTRKMVLR